MNFLKSEVLENSSEEWGHQANPGVGRGNSLYQLLEFPSFVKAQIEQYYK